MSKRKAIPVRVQVSVAIRQANMSAHTGFVRCPLCGRALTREQSRIPEHLTPHATMVALGNDPDDENNLAWVHAECAHKKTNGTKATTAGSDKHMIAKGKRLEIARLAKSEVEKRVTKERWRWKKKLDGTVVRVRTR